MSFDPKKYEEFSIALVKRIKAATSAYRRKWNKLQTEQPVEVEPDAIGAAYKEFVDEAEMCGDAEEPLLHLVEAIAGRVVTVPGDEDDEEPTRFPNMPELVAIATGHDGSDEPEVQFIGVLVNQELGVISELALLNNECIKSKICTYNQDSARVAGAAEVDQWAKGVLDPEKRGTAAAVQFQPLYRAWLAFCQ